ncbi:YdeI/OmpD-associated family protein [Asanoa sp. NPDC049573]|uniref:YdeI/OmpD-associated family protein n=1 Tax=Asanoa sp. NPDC049573 TaxID=3155396 RepID=UPI00341FC052
MRFRGIVALGGKTATGIEVPADVLAALGPGKRPPVIVTLGGHSYRTTVAPMGGASFVPLSAEHRTAAGVAAGDEIDVEIVLDTAERTVDVPPDLLEALDRAGGARSAFDALSYTRRKEWARLVESAKAPETRQRRIAKAVAELSGGQ